MHGVSVFRLINNNIMVQNNQIFLKYTNILKNKKDLNFHKISYYKSIKNKLS